MLHVGAAPGALAGRCGPAAPEKRKTRPRTWGALGNRRWGDVGWAPPPTIDRSATRRWAKCPRRRKNKDNPIPTRSLGYAPLHPMLPVLVPKCRMDALMGEACRTPPARWHPIADISFDTPVFAYFAPIVLSFGRLALGASALSLARTYVGAVVARLVAQRQSQRSTVPKGCQR